MSKLSKLLQVTEEERKAILKHYNTTEEEFLKNVQILKDWVAQSEHLPKDIDDNKYKLLLLNAKMSIEKSKRSIEGYFRVRNLYFNDIFDKLLPNTKEYQEGKRIVKTVVMPKLTPDLCRITIFQMNDPNGEATNAFFYELLVLMMAEIRISVDCCLSNIIIIDYSNYCLKNLIKYTPSVTQKLVNILNSINLRIQAIHFINVSPVVEQVLRIMKSFLPSKLMNKVIIHQDLASLHRTISPEYLPADWKGKEASIEKLYDEWCEQIEESEDLFKNLMEQKSTEKIELDPAQQDLFGCGVDGSFKQLAID